MIHVARILVGLLALIAVFSAFFGVVTIIIWFEQHFSCPHWLKECALYFVKGVFTIAIVAFIYQAGYDILKDFNRR